MAMHFEAVWQQMELYGRVFFNNKIQYTNKQMDDLLLCLGFEINGVVLRLGGGGPGTLKLCNG